MNPRAIDRGTQFNAVHVPLLEKLRPIALAETCRFLTIQSLEFQEIWPKSSYGNHVNDLSRQIRILTLAILKYYTKRFTANYENRLCQNVIRTVFTEGISCQFIVGK